MDKFIKEIIKVIDYDLYVMYTQEPDAFDDVVKLITNILEVHYKLGYNRGYRDGQIRQSQRTFKGY